MDIIDQLAILDLTGTDLIECMYGYDEMVWRQVDTLKKDSCLCDLLTEIVHSSELRIYCQMTKSV
jgi:hypothetical protein